MPTWPPTRTSHKRLAAASRTPARLTPAQQEFFLANPLEVCPGPNSPPPRCRGDLKGSFKFYFERGQPAQPFP